MILELIKDLGFKNLNSIRKDTGKQDRKAYGLYKCFCGNKFEAFKSSVKSGNTKSCGCYRKEFSKKMFTVHGLRSHRLYETWNGMMQRCNNLNAKEYNNYGGRGISVCERWLSVANFIEDMYPTFQEGLTLDRKDNDKGYDSDNCRWATKSVQASNTKKIQSNNTTGYRGIVWDNQRKKWRASISVLIKRKHLGHFENKIDAAIAYDKYIIDNNLEHTKNFN